MAAPGTVEGARAVVAGVAGAVGFEFLTDDREMRDEVQSRIANDIGGVDDVVTSTATSVVSNVTTVLATIVAGDGYQRALGDGGPATSAQLNRPVGLAVDSAYIAVAGLVTVVSLLARVVPARRATRGRPRIPSSS